MRLFSHTVTQFEKPWTSRKKSIYLLSISVYILKIVLASLSFGEHEVFFMRGQSFMGFIYYFISNTIPPLLVTELNNHSSIEFSISFIFIFRAESVHKWDLGSYNQFTKSLNAVCAMGKRVGKTGDLCSGYIWIPAVRSHHPWDSSVHFPSKMPLGASEQNLWQKMK